MQLCSTYPTKTPRSYFQIQTCNLATDDRTKRFRPNDVGTPATKYSYAEVTVKDYSVAK